MGGWRLSDRATELRKQYEDKYKEKARGWAWEEETMEEYEEYLDKCIKDI